MKKPNRVQNLKLRNPTFGVNYTSYADEFVSDGNAVNIEGLKECDTNFKKTRLIADYVVSSPTSAMNDLQYGKFGCSSTYLSMVDDTRGGVETVAPQDQDSNNEHSVTQLNVQQRPHRVLSSKEMMQHKNRRSYDMNLVPLVKKSNAFLRVWRSRTISDSKHNLIDQFNSPPALISCESGISSDVEKSNRQRGISKKSRNYNRSEKSSKEVDCPVCVDSTINYISPFIDGDSIIWVPKSRSEWEDCIDEMTSVCTAAAWHRHKMTKNAAPFYPPLSREYIRERIDIDDPLRGYQIRHKNGWLQGFAITTTFTTWTHVFHWDSANPQNGIDDTDRRVGLVDDGSLTVELERQKRSGDPNAGGIVWPTVAEIGLVGALGCGEYLLLMILDDLSHRGTYDYVVLQATDASRSFYEKFGFVRVGAVCKYGTEQDFEAGAPEVDLVGYRHWTYANETSERLNQHGVPSVMMARRIKRRINQENICSACSRIFRNPSFLIEVSSCFVLDKPRIEPLSAKKKVTTKKSCCNTSPFDDKDEIMSRSEDGPSAKRQKLCSISIQLNQGDNLGPCSTLANTGVVTRLRPVTPVGITSVDPISSTQLSNSKFVLRKQKIISSFRDAKKEYFYNKVVTPRFCNNSTFHYKSKYYFVLNYEEATKMIRLIPLFLRGTFKGNRDGRPKWKAIVLEKKSDDDKKYFRSMNIITAPCSKWLIVPSIMVTKCSSVAEESWDILE